MTAALDKRESYLARSALGLRDGDVKQSYRNWFGLYLGSADLQTWIGMAHRGLAVGRIAPHPEMSSFALTHLGAKAALAPGESLCPVDFPDAAIPARAGREGGA